MDWGRTCEVQHSMILSSWCAGLSFDFLYRGVACRGLSYIRDFYGLLN